jgi:hypothetical protein
MELTQKFSNNVTSGKVEDGQVIVEDLLIQTKSKTRFVQIFNQ